MTDSLKSSYKAVGGGIFQSLWLCYPPHFTPYILYNAPRRFVREGGDTV